MADLVGRNLGQYRVTEPLGRGGMATVYKGYQPSMDRIVAIKVLPLHFAHDPHFAGRFDQEAKVIAKLEHARILPVYDYGTDNDITYIVMRYLEGGTLSEILKARRLPLTEIARIISQIAEGLDYAHKKNIIHRDIKPSNIILDHSGDVYITDFGIAKLVEGSGEFTGSAIVGTPDYVSPEQALGEVIDHRSDIYSLGIVLYQMCTNDLPYHAETPMAVMVKHIHEPLPMPRSITPDLPETVEMVILRALAKDPTARFSSCGQMAAALNKAISGVAPEVAAAAPQVAGAGSTAPGATRASAATPPMISAQTRPDAATSSDSTARLAAESRPGWLIPVVAGSVILVLALVLLVGMLAGQLLNRPGLPQAAPPVQPVNITQPIQTGQPVNAGQPAQTVQPGLPPVQPTPGGQPAPGGQPGQPPGQPGGGPSADSILYSDTFDNPPGAEWQPHNLPLLPTVSNGALALPLAAGSHLLGGDAGTISAPMLLVAIPENAPVPYTVETVMRFSPTAEGQGAGLVLASAQGLPVFALTRSLCQPPACIGGAVYFDHLGAARLNPQGYQRKVAALDTSRPPEAPLMLRLVIDPAGVTAYQGDRPQNMVVVGTWALPEQAEDPLAYAGLLAYNAVNSGGSLAEFLQFYILNRVPGP
jgi:predicted Ser/Thr protein kinase